MTTIVEPSRLILALALVIVHLTQADAAAPPTAPLLDAHGDALPEGAIARLGSVRMREPTGLRRVWFIDNKRLVTTGHGFVRIWDVETGKLLRAIPGWDCSHDADIVTIVDVKDPKSLILRDAATGKDRCCISTLGPVVFSPDAKFVVSLPPNEHALLWDASTGKQLQRLNRSNFLAAEATFSSDSRMLACAMGERIYLHDVAKGKDILTLPRPGRRFLGMGFSPDGQTFVVVARSGQPAEKILQAWDVPSGKEKYSDVMDWRRWFCFGGFVAASGELVLGGNAIYFLDSAMGKEIRHFALPTPTERFAISPDGKTGASWDPPRQVVTLWDLKTGKPRVLYSGHEQDIWNLAFSPAGKSLLSTAANDNHVWLWDAAKGTEQVKLPAKAAPLPMNIGISSDGAMVAALHDHNKVHIWDILGKKVRNVDAAGIADVRSFALSPDGKIVALSGLVPSKRNQSVSIESHAGVLLLTVEKGKEIKRFEGFGGNIEHIGFTPDGKQLLIAVLKDSRKREIVSFDTKSFVEVGRITELYSTKMVISGTGKSLFATTALHEFGMFEVSTMNLRARWTVPNPPSSSQQVFVMAASGSGRFVALGRRGEPVMLWDVRRANEVWRDKASEGPLMRATFHQDRLLAVASGGTALVYDVARLAPTESLPVVRIAKAELAKVWDDLASKNAETAYAEMQKLWGSPEQAVELLSRSLGPLIATKEDQQRIAKLIQALDAEEFNVRTAATKDLATLGNVAIPALRHAASNSHSLEVRRRTMDVLSRLEVALSRDTPPETLRLLRVVEVLEGIASPEAMALLERAAMWSSSRILADDASVALRRLKGR